LKLPHESLKGVQKLWCQRLKCELICLLMLPENTHTRVSFVVLCEYSKFRIESNSYLSFRFQMSTIIRNFRQFLTYLTELRRFFTLATTPSSQQNQQT